MILSKLQVGLVGAFAAALVLSLGWQVRNNAQLRAELARRSTAAKAELATLQERVATEARRVAAAEMRVAALLQAAEVAKSSQVTAAARTTTLDTSEAVKTAIARSAELMREGKTQEAIDELVRCYREVQGVRPGSSECQSLMGQLLRLGRSHPSALVALADMRDRAMTQMRAKPARKEWVFEIALLNERLNEGERNVALFDSLPVDDPTTRQNVAFVGFTSFVKARRYSEALLGRRFGQMLSQLEAFDRTKDQVPAEYRDAAREQSIATTLTHIEVLTGAGKIDDARLLTEKLLAFDGTDATRARLQELIARA
ncbi:MAG: hypothetical protein ABIZ49_07935 [Opitutaceae bacterium]